MKKIKFRISNWEKGRLFMKEIAEKFTVNIEERDADLFIENSKFTLSCHFDEGQFSFILLKLQNIDLETKFDTIIKNYKI